MATTTVEVYVEEQKRLEYLKGVYGVSGIKDIIKLILDQSGYSSLKDIELLRKHQKKVVE